MHPSRDELSGLVLGMLIEDDVDQIADHVEQCPVCEETVREMETMSDEMIRSLRGPVVQHPLEQESHCRRLLEVVEAIGQDLSSGDGVNPPVAEDLRTIRDYQLVAKLGQGGMGAVYKALHTQLQKVVALKVLSTEQMNDKKAVERFRREMQAVGRLSHPNIVGAFDAGEHEGRHYLVMEYVEGVDLSELVRQLGPLPIADACELIRQAAVGLQHAHEHGLVHRDVKPSNIMITPDGQLKILDLGLARLHNGQLADLTSTGQMMGTVDFMAPEQSGDSHGVDIRADIYGLGATLYKLLSGQAPYANPKYDSLVKKLMALATEPITPIKYYRPDVPDELATLLHQMVEKGVEDRPATPNEIVDAIAPHAESADLVALMARYRELTKKSGPDENEVSSRSTHQNLKSSFSDTTPSEAEGAEDDGRYNTTPATPLIEPMDVIGVASDVSSVDDTPQPVAHERTPGVLTVAEAEASGWWNRTTKFVAALTGMAALLVALTVINLQTDKGTIEIVSHVPDIEVTIKRDSKVVDGFQVEQRDGGASYYSGDYEIEIVGGMADGVVITNKKFTLTRGKDVLVEISRVFARNHESQAPPDSVAASSQSTQRSDVGAEGIEEIRVLEGHEGQVNCMEMFADGKYALSGGNDGTLRLWDLATGNELPRSMKHSESIWCVAVSPDGKYAVSGGGGTYVDGKPVNKDFDIRLWDIITGEEIRRFKGHESKVYGLAFSSDGAFIMSSSADGTVRQWRVRDGSEMAVLRGHERSVRCIALSPDDRLAVSGSSDSTIRLWNLITAKEIRVLDGHWEVVTSVTFSPDGRYILSASTDTTMRLWDVETGKLVRQFRGHQTGVYSAGFAPNGRVAISGSGVLPEGSGIQRPAGWDYRLRLWDVQTGQELRRWTSHTGGATQVRFGLKGGSVLTSGCDGTLLLWSLPDMETLEKQAKQYSPAPERQFVWPQNLLQAGQIPAPSLGEIEQVAHDEFNNSNSGFYKGFFRNDPNSTEFGYESGRYFIEPPTTGLAVFGTPWKRYSNFACQMVGRVAAPSSGLWGVAFLNSEHHGIAITIDTEGRLQIGPDPFEVETFRGPQIGPIEHVAIKSGNEFNTILVIIRGRQIEVYVNSVAVVQPFYLDRDITPASVRLRYGASDDRQNGDPRTRIELERITVWPAESVPSLEARGAVAK
ncbi:MAG: serine/threonine protein kinase [Planctomycetota bacterium]|nr:serine/threonine protein kinase [Planctomycetota bacterium]